MIEARGLVKRYGSTIAVDNLSFDVMPGTVTGFLGPNGAGKSTTMRMMLGLDRPDAGSVRIGGKSYHDLRSPLREVGALLEAKAFHPGRTARSHLNALAVSNSIPKGRVNEVLAITGLEKAADRRAGKFSLGMSQRLGIAAAMLGRPPLLIIDEPTNGLDPAGIREIRGLLRGLAAEGTTIFLSSHLLAEVEQVCDRVAVIVGGRLVEEGAPAMLGAIKRRVRVEVRAADSGAAARLLARWTARPADGQFLVEHDSGRDVNGALMAGGVIAESVTVERPGLEDRFLEITGKEDARAVAAGS